MSRREYLANKIDELAGEARNIRKREKKVLRTIREMRIRQRLTDEHFTPVQIKRIMARAVKQKLRLNKTALTGHNMAHPVKGHQEWLDERVGLYHGYHEHRLHVVRFHSRACVLAMCFIKGTPYKIAECISELRLRKNPIKTRRGEDLPIQWDVEEVNVGGFVQRLWEQVMTNVLAFDPAFRKDEKSISHNNPFGYVNPAAAQRREAEFGAWLDKANSWILYRTALRDSPSVVHHELWKAATR